jgi:hypothetical protein
MAEDYDYNNIFDEGSGATPSVSEAVFDAPKVEPAEDTSGAESSVKDADKATEGENVSGQQTEEQKPADEWEKFEKEVDQSLSDEKTPKWYRNAVTQYKEKLNEIAAKGESNEFSDYGDPEEVKGNLDLMKRLDEIRVNPQTGVPEPTSEGFAKGLYEKQPDSALRLLTDLAQLPSHETEGYRLIDEVVKHVLGIDPARVEDIKAFAAAGYKINAPANVADAPPPEELKRIPENLREAYSSLSPDERVRIEPFDGEDATDTAFRTRVLTARQAELDFERSQKAQETEKAQSEQRAEAEKQQVFQRELQTETLETISESGGRIFTSFVDSLVKQAEMTDLDAAMIANTVVAAIQSPQTVEGKQSLAALAKAGVEIDPAIGSLLTEWEEVSSGVAYFKKTAQTVNLDKAKMRQSELERQIAVKGNKIIASLAQKRASAIASPILKKNDLLTKATTQNGLTAAGSPSNIRTGNFSTNKDYTDDAYQKDGIFG